MAQSPQTAPNGTELLDGFTTFEGGMNSGIAVSLLPRNQLAFCSNGTVRGGYATPRPPYRTVTIDYGGDAALQLAVETGRWQGACYAQPDTGPESLVASISGRLYEFIIVGTVATCYDRTIAGDPNDAAAPQAWLWQADRWVFVTNGVDLPIYFDCQNKTAVRSTGTPQWQVGTVSVNFVCPAIGSNVSVTCAAAWPPNGTTIYFGNMTYAVSGGVIVSADVTAAWQMVVVSGGGGAVAVLRNVDCPNVGSTFLAPFDFLYRVGVQQFPVGRQGAFWRGRVWMALGDGLQFVAGDISGGPLGTFANNYRDSILNVTENLYLVGGGNFSVPGAVGKIQAFVPIAELDASLGQGQLAVLTPQCVFTLNCTTDRLTWQQLTNPILSVSLLAFGGKGQYSTVPANGDTIMRSIDGIRSLILARREFATWGNVPISREMNRILPLDNKKLLAYGSAVVFENRLLMTVGPTAVEGRGVYHPGLVALNFDPLSSMAGKSPSVYDGVWTGLNVLQVLRGAFDEEDRGFAFHLNIDVSPPRIELFEILNTPADIYSNNSTVVFADVYDDGIYPVVMSFESPELNCGERDPRTRTYKSLIDGVIFVDCLVGQVTFEAWYKPDQYPCWVPWIKTVECAVNGAGESLQFRPEIGLGAPDATVCDPTTNRPLRDGYTFQFKLVVQGHCRVKGARFRFAVKPDPKFRAPQCLPICTT